jgi:hypothetical protein
LGQRALQHPAEIDPADGVFAANIALSDHGAVRSPAGAATDRQVHPPHTGKIDAIGHEPDGFDQSV